MISFTFEYYFIVVFQEGGGTSFPRAFKSRGISVRPESGGAVLFYNVLPDGNGDISAEHSGMPVLKGDKYFTNVWVHDYCPDC